MLASLPNYKLSKNVYLKGPFDGSVIVMSQTERTFCIAHTVHFHLITHFVTNKMYTFYYTIQLLSTMKLIQRVSVLQWNHHQGFKP